MENKGKREDPLRELSLEFAEKVVATARRVREEHKEFSLADQLLRSGTSIGANLSEAVYAASRSDFLNKNKIALKECSETLYWIQLLQRCGVIPKEDARALWKTCDQLRSMIASACKTIETTK